VTIFKADPSLGTTVLYRERKNYKENFKVDGYRFLDTWYESPFYGRLNENYEPVFFPDDETSDSLQNLGPLAADINSTPFLAQAFNNFVNEYVLIVQNSNIGYPIFLEGLTPQVAHQSFQKVYSEYVQYLSSLLLPNILRDKKTHTFKSFLSRVIDFSLLGNNRYPITKSGFLMSRYCPVGVTGLTIELTKLPKNTDANKSMIFEDPAFKCFLDFSKKHGMIVDKNLPWRLYADLSSEKMQNYIRKVDSPDSVNIRSYTDYLNRFYRTKPAFDDHHSLFETVVRMFVTYSGKTFGDVQREALSDFGSTADQRMENFIGELLKVRMLEMGMSLKNYNLEVKKILDYHRIYSVRYEEQGKDKFSPVLGRIQKITSSHYKQLLENRSIDSYKKTVLKDYE